MGGNEEPKGNGLGKVDSAFKKISDYVGKKISTFVAFLFFIFAAGAVYGAFATMRLQFPYAEMLIITPAVLGLVAYYNRAFATVIFVAVVLLFIVI